MKNESLTSTEIEKYASGNSNTDIIAKVQLTDQEYPYNEQEFKSNVDLWVEREFGNDAVIINGYKARLLDMSDAESLGFSSSGGL